MCSVSLNVFSIAECVQYVKLCSVNHYVFKIIMLFLLLFVVDLSCEGAQWLIGRVLDSTEGPRVQASQVSLHCGT